MAAAAVELRDPLLLPLYPENRPVMAKFLRSPLQQQQPQQKKRQPVVRRSASLNVRPRAGGEMADERAVLRESTKANSKAAVPPPEAEKVVGSEEPPLLPAVAEVRHDGAEEAQDPESGAMLRLKMEAMTWAAVAKDEAIAALEQRLRAALEIARAEQERRAEVERLARESREREGEAKLALSSARVEITRLAEEEERLVSQLGNLEVEAGEEDRMYRAQIAALTGRVAAQDRLLAASGERGEAHCAKEEEMEALRAELRDAKVELRASEGRKRDLLRRVRAAENERRDSAARRRVGRALRSARLARMRDDSVSGSGAWTLFSVPDSQA